MSFLAPSYSYWFLEFGIGFFQTLLKENVKIREITRTTSSSGMVYTFMNFETDKDFHNFFCCCRIMKTS